MWGYIFTGVCLWTPVVDGGGVLLDFHPIILPTTGPMSFLEWGTTVTGPRSLLGGTPVQGGGTPVLDGEGVPQSQAQGVTQSQAGVP